MAVSALFVIFVLCFLIQICGSPQALAGAGDDGGPGFYVNGGVSRYILALPDYAPIQAFNYSGGAPYTLVKRLAVNLLTISEFFAHEIRKMRTGRFKL